MVVINFLTFKFQLKREVCWVFTFFFILTLKGKCQESWSALADSAYENGEFDLAVSYYDSLLQNEFSNDSLIFYWQLSKSKSLQFAEKFSESYNSFRKCDSLLSKVNSADLKFLYYISFAEYLRAMMRFDNAFLQLNLAKGLAAKSNVKKINQAYYYNRLAAVINESSPQFDSVIFYTNKALDIAIEIQDKAIEGSCLNELGFINEHHDNLKVAISQYKQSITCFKAISDERSMVSVMSNLGRSLLKNKQYKEAKQITLEAIKVCEGKEWAGVKKTLYANLVSALQNLEQYKDALHWQQLYSQQMLILAHKEWTKELASIALNLKVEEQQFEMEQLEHQKQQQLERNKFLKESLLLGLIVVTTLAFLVFRFLRVNKRLNRVNREKDFLIKEVHHRVKNNLQALQSLLNIQVNYLEDYQQIQLLKTIMRRLEAIGFTHHLLYRNEASNKVNIKEYIEQLVTSLMESSGVLVSKAIYVEPIEVDADRCIEIGIIVSELISNSIKHAKVSGELGFDLRITAEGNKLKFEYKDNGKVNPSLKVDYSKSLGLKLISIFVKKLKGVQQNELGYGMSFKFPYSL